jgi:5S rRNA maturation endonuclease (ribonuclease M5)
MTHVQNRKFEAFQDFLRSFVVELNNLSEEGGVVLVEGKRDMDALREIGYTGGLLSVSSFNSKQARKTLGNAKSVVILTDLDRQGRQLAARYTKLLRTEGVAPSLAQRKRLSQASKGTFLHIENLRRFSELWVAHAF